MIRKLSYIDINFTKYNRCLENAVQQNFFAKKDILDFLCDQWELIVYGDYEYIMPVPLKKKACFRFVLNPLFCQQLGIFGPDKNSGIELQLLNFMQKNYRVYIYHFNADNTANKLSDQKKNYCIPKTEYAFQKKKYFKGRKSSVKSGQHLYFKNIKLEESTIHFIRSNFKGLTKEADIRLFINYLHFLNETDYLKLYAALKDQKLLNLAIVIEDTNTNYLLGLINDPEELKNEGASFLIDQILQEQISLRNFSFMGSSIRGIEVFFKSFGAELHSFPVLRRNKKELLLTFFKRL